MSKGNTYYIILCLSWSIFSAGRAQNVALELTIELLCHCMWRRQSVKYNFSVNWVRKERQKPSESVYNYLLHFIHCY